MLSRLRNWQFQGPRPPGAGRPGGWLLLAALLCLFAPGAQADGPSHGIAMIGEPELPPDFTHFPYVNPDAPKGGALVYGEAGGFDSLNPHITKGRFAWGMRVHVFESLMARSWDEAFTLYGLIAETIETPADRAWVEFHLRPEARFSDGDPVTVDDVIFSVEILRDKGRGNMRRFYGEVASIDRVGERGVRFNFGEPEPSESRNRELPLLLGLMPIHKKAYWDGREFDETTLEPPVGTGPYVVESVEANRSIRFRRNPDYWAKDLPVRRGLHNYDVIRYEYFRDRSAQFEAFKTGEIRVYWEGDPDHWEEAYGFPAARDGHVKKAGIKHGRPSGMRGFVLNTRLPLFQDLRVRRALEAAFDFEWINETLHRSAFNRTTSYFSNSELAHSGPAEGLERELLLPFADQLPSGTLEEGWQPTTGDGSGRDRQRLRRARNLLEEAGWTVQDGILRNADGGEFQFEVLVKSASDENISELFAESLESLGIKAMVRLVDSAQYQARRTEYDYDVIIERWGLSLSPGSEQAFYWGSGGVETPGSRNYMGVASPAVDAMVKVIPEAKNQEELTAATRALDRVLSAGTYVIPFWHSSVAWFAWWEEQRFPPPPVYGMWIEWSAPWWTDPDLRP